MELPPKRVKTLPDPTNNGDSRTTAKEAAIVSEEMEQNTERILLKIDHFTQQVSEMLEAGRTIFKNLTAEFEERLIAIHKEQVEKWQDEIRELQARDASNEEAQFLIQNAQSLLVHPPSP